MTKLTPKAHIIAIQAGLYRGWVETRQNIMDPAYFIFYLIFPITYAIVLLFMRGSTVPGTEFALGAMVLPSLIGMSIAFSGFTGPAGTIAMDKEDGTLLRAKATPNGMLGYLIGKIVMFALTTLFGLLILVAPGLMVASELVLNARSWVLLFLLFGFGMLATIPISVALGALVKSSAQSGFVVLASIILIVPSGIFYPITSLPTWLQWFGQAFPFYWLGLGARAAMLPAEMAAIEIGASWRFFEMFAVLSVWSIIGLIIAPVILRRLARTHSGSAVAQARERVMAKGY